eukprot:2742898-Pyramimonas_sp.AAC.1
MHWKLQKAIHGTPEASMLFQREVGDKVEQNKCQELKAACRCTTTRTWTLYVQDMGVAVEADDEELGAFGEIMATHAKSSLNREVEPGGAAEGTSLHRAVLWGEEGFGALQGPKLILKMAELCDVKEAKRAETPNSKRAAKGVRESEDPVPRQSSMVHRICGGIAQYLAGDRLEQSCSCKDPRAKRIQKQERL